MRAIDMRTAAAQDMIRFRDGLTADLGGEEAIGAAERAAIDMAARTKLLIDSADAWILEQKSIVNARKRTLIPVISQRQQLVDSLIRILDKLGLKDRAKDVPSISVIRMPPICESTEEWFDRYAPPEIRQLKNDSGDDDSSDGSSTTNQSSYEVN